jgi:hypothetical protein
VVIGNGRYVAGRGEVKMRGRGFFVKKKGLGHENRACV